MNNHVVYGGRQQGRTYEHYRLLVEKMLAGTIPMSKEVEKIFKRYNNDIDAITKALMEHAKQERRKLMRQASTANKVEFAYDEFLLYKGDKHE
ncbi:MAG: hypothetical protein IKL08_06020 [Clostridia bacterium]|nr:hypothetical protein [Clostridia bacterium]